MVLSFALASAAGFWLLVLMYQAGTALLARRLGIVVEEVAVGVGPSLAVWRRDGEVWRFRPLPLGGYTRLRGMEEDVQGTEGQESEPGSFQAAPVDNQLLVSAAGPVVCLVLGGLLLAVAGLLGHPQLEAVPAPREEEPPTLAHGPEPSTLAGQLRLADDTAGRYAARLLTFRSLDGWGGYVAFFVTAGRAGRDSVVDWLTLMGIAGLGFGVLNLLPLPALNGFQMLHTVLAAALGRPRLPERVTLAVAYAGLALVLVLFGRVIWLDVGWVWRSLQA